jgi:hypothetical protein
MWTSKTNKEGSTNILKVVNLYPVFEKCIHNFEPCVYSWLERVATCINYFVLLKNLCFLNKEDERNGVMHH